jgi:hypothetical protein
MYKFNEVFNERFLQDNEIDIPRERNESSSEKEPDAVISSWPPIRCDGTRLQRVDTFFQSRGQGKRTSPGEPAQSPPSFQNDYRPAAFSRDEFDQN